MFFIILKLLIFRELSIFYKYKSIITFLKFSNDEEKHKKHV